jgi:hypothetical protein
MTFAPKFINGFVTCFFIESEKGLPAADAVN